MHEAHTPLGHRNLSKSFTSYEYGMRNLPINMGFSEADDDNQHFGIARVIREETILALSMKLSACRPEVMDLLSNI